MLYPNSEPPREETSTPGRVAAAPVVLPDDYLRKMKQNLGEVEAQVESETCPEPDPEFSLIEEDDTSPT